MNKEAFLAALRKGLSGYPEEEIEERLTFYSEWIDDRIEDGVSEEAAVAELGTVEEMIPQIVADIPLTKLVKARIKPGRKLGTMEIALLLLGAPLWLPLLIAAASLCLSVCVAFCSVLLSLWVIDLSLAVGAVGCIVACFFSAKSIVLYLCAACVLAGLSILLFFGCKFVTGYTVLLAKKFILWIKSLLQKKGENT